MVKRFLLWCKSFYRIPSADNDGVIFSTDYCRIMIILHVCSPTGLSLNVTQHGLHSSTCCSVDRAISPVLLWSRPVNGLPFRPRPSRSPPAMLCAMLLLLSGNVELNPGDPNTNLNIGHLNICSAASFQKQSLLHHVVTEFSLDVLTLNETRILADDPPAVKLGIAPSGYTSLHVARKPDAPHPRGGGLAIVFRSELKITPHPLVTTLPEFTSFELQLVKVTSAAAPFTVANVYRPPSSSLSDFLDELDLFISTMTPICGERLVICGDVNAPGSDSSSINA